MSYPKYLLCVEDDDDVREICQLSLRASDRELVVTACADGLQALAAVAEQHPDVILLDVMMPLLDGPATLARLQADAHTAQIPVIFLTAKATADEMRRLTRLGAIDVMFKPFDPRTLLTRVRESLQKAGKSEPATA